MPPEHFERARGGTLFLDEVGQLPFQKQPVLLRAVENREFTPVGSDKPQAVQTRVVAATNVDLEQAIRTRTFRQDLYARLAGLVIDLPPLRRRRLDIPLLARHFLDQAGLASTTSWTAGFLHDLLVYDWPMNVRELKTIMQRLALVELGEGGVLSLDHLKDALKLQGPK